MKKFVEVLKKRKVAAIICVVLIAVIGYGVWFVQDMRNAVEVASSHVDPELETILEEEDTPLAAAPKVTTKTTKSTKTTKKTVKLSKAATKTYASKLPNKTKKTTKTVKKNATTTVKTDTTVLTEVTEKYTKASKNKAVTTKVTTTMKSIYTLLLAIGTVIIAWAQPVSTQQAPHVAILGDSNTWMGGDDCSGDEAWPLWFKQRYPTASCRSYARSGATWTNTPRTELNTAEDTALLADNNVIFNQVYRLIEAHSAQLIIIATGVNDAWFNDMRPDAFTLSPQDASLRRDWSYLYDRTPDQVLTLAESIAYDCHLLQQAFPEASIVLVTPAHTIEVKPWVINTVGAIITATATRLRIYSLNLGLISPINHYDEKKHFTYTSDGTHTNTLGAQAHGEIIAKYIASLTSRPEPCHSCFGVISCHNKASFAVS